MASERSVSVLSLTQIGEINGEAFRWLESRDTYTLLFCSAETYGSLGEHSCLFCCCKIMLRNPVVQHIFYSDEVTNSLDLRLFKVRAVSSTIIISFCMPVL